MEKILAENVTIRYFQLYRTIVTHFLLKVVNKLIVKGHRYELLQMHFPDLGK